MNRLLILILCLSLGACAEDKKGAKKSSLSSLSEYLHTYGTASLPGERRPAGSLWSPENPFPEMASDYRAQRLNDLVTIRIVEQTLAQASSDLSSQRKAQASSAITSIAGKNFSSLNPILSLNSDNTLSGKGQSNSQTKLQTSVAGRVAAVLPNGVIVVEAERRVRMNNETQTIVLRGMARPGDVLSDNSLLSTSLANLEIELKGKGVVSDATRPYNRFLRALFWLVGF